MNTMNKLIRAFLFAAGALLTQPALAAGASIHMDPFPAAKLKDLAALQNGARIFANHCLNCHSAALMRWNRLHDIGLSDAQIKEYLIFGDQKVGDMMKIASSPADGKAWFGKMPPDLSVIVRARTSFDYKGTDYLYTLLRGYYRDNSIATGWNNVAYPNIGMPHILWEQQGPREATIEHVTKGDKGLVRTVSVFDVNGNVTTKTEPVTGYGKEGTEFSFKPVDAAKARKYDEDIADLVAYLAFMTDPSAAARTRIGVWVLVFLVIFTGLAYWLNGKFWRDVK
jgi:ubiquinol-cytochrome c reductase cytochrome c1 subunit